MTSNMLSFLIWTTLFLGVCLFALVRGNKPEIISVVILIIADILSLLPLRGKYWAPLEPSLAVIDFFVAAFFVWLALHSSRWWPLWAAAFHILAFIMLIINALDPAIRPYAYYAGEQIWDYLGLMALFFGSMIEGRRTMSGLRRH